MTSLNNTLDQFTARYRSALLLKVGVWAGLGLAIVSILAWRLHTVGLNAIWWIALPVALAMIAAGGIAWWIRPKWISRVSAAAHLDQVMKLQQRLVTAEEFSHVKQAPALYPILVEDTTNRLSPGQARLPHPVNRTACLLAAVLLLLLLWPIGGSAPIQLAALTGIGPEFMQQKVPPESSPEAGQDGAGSSQQASDQGESSKQQGRGDQQRGEDGGSEGSQADSPDPQQGDDASSSSSAQSESEAGSKGEQGEAGDMADASAARGDLESAEDRASQGADSQDTRMQMEQAKATERAELESGRSQAMQQARSDDSEKGEEGLGSAKGASGANQDRLKADIQELLEELSGELKTLQEQLGESQQQPDPLAGTDTDPELYGSASGLESASGETLPIQLGTDTEPTARKRPGGGVGDASGEISDALPQMQAQASELAEKSLEERPISRQSIPPEYRSVFDRLYGRKNTSSEVKP